MYRHIPVIEILSRIAVAITIRGLVMYNPNVKLVSKITFNLDALFWKILELYVL